MSNELINEEIAEDGGEVRQDQHKGADHAQLMAAEFPAHQAPLGGVIVFIVPDLRGLLLFFFHFRHPIRYSLRALGSSQARRTSEINVPITVTMAMMKSQLPARYMS